MLEEPKTTSEKIQRALDFFDGKMNARYPWLSEKQRYSHVGVTQNIMEKVRTLKQALDSKSRTEQDILHEISCLLADAYTTLRTESQPDYCLALLDAMLFSGINFKDRPTKVKIGGKNSVLETLALSNLLFLGTSDIRNNYTTQEIIEILIQSVANSAVESVLFILENFKDIPFNAPCNQLKNTALMLAIAKGRLHKDNGGNSKLSMDLIIDKLFEMAMQKPFEFDPHINDKIGMTSLHLAVLQRDVVSINMLKSFGADSNIKNIQEQTPMDFLELPYQEAKKLLRDYVYGLDTNRRVYLEDFLFNWVRGDIYTPYDQSTWENSKNIIKLMLSESTSCTSALVTPLNKNANGRTKNDQMTPSNTDHALRGRLET